LLAAGWLLDYVMVRRSVDLSPVPGLDEAPGSLVVLGVAKLGRSRLIDNIEILEATNLKSKTDSTGFLRTPCRR